MNEIKVLISGTILMVAPVAWNTGGISKNINAAVAIEARHPYDSKYDVEIPRHDATIKIPDKAIDAGNVNDPDGRITKDGNQRVVELRGDVVQFGVFDTGTKKCTPLPDDDDVILSDAIRDLISLSDVSGIDQKLKAGAHPDKSTGTSDYAAMARKLVAAWMEIPQGSLRVAHTKHPSEDRVEFRPGRKARTTVDTVRWNLGAGAANCVAITPFGQPAKRISIPFAKNESVRVEYANMAQPGDGGDVYPGAGYDFELFYGVVDNAPAFPPLPYAVELPKKQPEAHGGSGVNCGPIFLP